MSRKRDDIMGYDDMRLRSGSATMVDGSLHFVG